VKVGAQQATIARRALERHRPCRPGTGPAPPVATLVEARRGVAVRNLAVRVVSWGGLPKRMGTIRLGRTTSREPRSAMTHPAPLRPAVEALGVSGIQRVFDRGIGRDDVIGLWVGESDLPTP